MLEIIFNNQWYVIYLAAVMVLSNVAKEYGLLIPTFNWIIDNVKSKRALVAIISCISGILPIPGRVTVSAGILNTIAPKDDRKQVYGLIDYLSTHHYYFWSPLEKTVILPMAILSLSYVEFLSYVWPLLATALIFILYYIFFVLDENDIVVEAPKEKYEKITSWLDFKLLAILFCVIALGNYLQTLYPILEDSINSTAIFAATTFSFVVAFILGSSGKFAGVVSLLCSVFGVKYLPLFFAVEYAGYMLSPFHKCFVISRGVFNTMITQFYKIIGLFCGLIFVAGVLTTEAKADVIEEVIVEGKNYPQFGIVGEYNQPAWTLTRKFPSTRVYVMTPPGEALYEKWFDIRDREDGPPQIRMRDEIAIGLGKRLELDLYLHTVYDGPKGFQEFDWRGFSWEVRYALADWGQIWGNPTLYFEHKLKNGKQGIEPKLLLGDRIGASSYIWGLNLIYEANIADTKEEQEREYAATFSLGKVFNDDLTVGLSTMYRYNDFDGTSEELYFGPNLQYRFNNKAHISVEYMPKVSDVGYSSRSYIIFAWRF